MHTVRTLFPAPKGSPVGGFLPIFRAQRGPGERTQNDGVSGGQRPKTKEPLTPNDGAHPKTAKYTFPLSRGIRATAGSIPRSAPLLPRPVLWAPKEGSYRRNSPSLPSSTYFFVQDHDRSSALPVCLSIKYIPKGNFWTTRRGS